MPPFYTKNIVAGLIGAKKAQSYQQQFHLGWRSWLGLQARSQATNHIIQLAIKQHFDPEFINRIDYMLIYEAMTQEQLPQLFDIELLKISQRLQKKGITITVSPSAKHFLLTEYDDQYGARYFIRRLKTQLEPKLAKAINQQTHTNQFSVQFINGLLGVEPIVQKGE